MSKHILVTGSSGMIGTELCLQLIKKKYNVVGLDRVSNEWDSKVDKITEKIDLLDLYKLEKFLENSEPFDLVIHLAANARVYELIVDPNKALENWSTVFNVLEACRKKTIPIIFASSREVYGDVGQFEPASEDSLDIMMCKSPYTASKIGGEAMVFAYGASYNLPFSIVRFSNVYGRYDSHKDRAIPIFAKQAMANETMTVYGASKILDWTHIEDAVYGLILVIEDFEKAQNNVFNLAAGKADTVLKVAELIKQQLNSTSKIEIGETRTGEVERCVVDISNAQKILGYAPKVSLEDGIKKNLSWLKVRPSMG